MTIHRITQILYFVTIQKKMPVHDFVLAIQKLLDIKNIKLLEVLHDNNNSLNLIEYSALEKSRPISLDIPVNYFDLLTSETGYFNPLQLTFSFLFCTYASPGASITDTAHQYHHGIEWTDEECLLRKEQLLYWFKKYGKKDTAYIDYLRSNSRSLGVSSKSFLELIDRAMSINDIIDNL